MDEEAARDFLCKKAQVFTLKTDPTPYGTLEVIELCKSFVDRNRWNCQRLAASRSVTRLHRLRLSCLSLILI